MTEEEKGILETAKEAIYLITRPPRAQYNLRSLGGIEINEEIIIPRLPVSFINSKGLQIVGSFYPPINYPNESILGCVVYLHGNIGSQLEGRFLVKYLSLHEIGVYCFDFTGSGHSEGKFVTLGYNERQDVIDALKFLQLSFKISKVVLWGRSMGASTAILAAPNLPTCIGLIIDSAYSSIDELFSDISEKTPLPSALQPVALWWVKKKVKKTLGFEISDLSPEKISKTLNIPILIGHPAEDTFIPYRHSIKIFNSYLGKDKQLIALTGDHNSNREPEWLSHCFSFIFKLFNLNYQINSNDIEKNLISQHVKNFIELSN